MAETLLPLHADLLAEAEALARALFARQTHIVSGLSLVESEECWSRQAGPLKELPIRICAALLRDLSHPITGPMAMDAAERRLIRRVGATGRGWERHTRWGWKLGDGHWFGAVRPAWSCDGSGHWFQIATTTDPAAAMVAAHVATEKEAGK